MSEHRHLGEDLAQRAELLDRLQLGDQVLECELALEDPLGILFGLLLVDDLLEVLNEADDVPHAEDAGRQAFRAKFFESVDRFAGTDELDGNARDMLD